MVYSLIYALVSKNHTRLVWPKVIPPLYQYQAEVIQVLLKFHYLVYMYCIMPAKNQSSTQKQDQAGMEALKHKDQAGMKLLKRTQYQDQDGMFKGWYWSNTGQQWSELNLVLSLNKRHWTW